MARATSHLALAGALLALPLLAAGPALAKHKHHGKSGGGESGKVNSTAYPKAPGGMPAANDKGKPVEPNPDAAAKPGAPAKASTEGATQKEGTSSTAYPGAPGGTPAAGDNGKPIDGKPAKP